MNKEMSFVLLTTTLLFSMFLGSFHPVSAYAVENPHMHSEIAGDIDNNCQVDIFDMVIIAIAFGSQLNSSNFDIRADTNDDGVIDIFDIAGTAANFGYRENPPIVYSTDFTFCLPVDGYIDVSYYFIVKVYVPATLSGRLFKLMGTTNNLMRNAKIDN